MIIQVKCPFCKKMFTVSINMRCKKVRCTSCRTWLVLGESEPPKSIVENK